MQRREFLRPRRAGRRRRVAHHARRLRARERAQAALRAGHHARRARWTGGRAALRGSATMRGCGASSRCARPGERGGALPLDGFFGLHPVARLHAAVATRRASSSCFTRSPALTASARTSTARTCSRTARSQPHALQTGWLNRALAQLRRTPRRARRGVALGQNVPLVMRGPAAGDLVVAVAACARSMRTRSRASPTSTPAIRCWRTRLADALAADAMADGGADSHAVGGAMGRQRGVPAARRRPPRARAAAATPRYARDRAGRGRVPAPGRRPAGRGVRYHRLGHACQRGRRRGPARGPAGALDAGLATSRQQLGPAWTDTAVLLVTEFGRTAADQRHARHRSRHGDGGVTARRRGRRRAGDRRLAGPRRRARSTRAAISRRRWICARVLKGLLAEQLGVPSRALATDVFPDSANAKPLAGLLRA